MIQYNNRAQIGMLFIMGGSVVPRASWQALISAVLSFIYYVAQKPEHFGGRSDTVPDASVDPVLNASATLADACDQGGVPYVMADAFSQPYARESRALRSHAPTSMLP